MTSGCLARHCRKPAAGADAKRQVLIRALLVRPLNRRQARPVARTARNLAACRNGRMVRRFPDGKPRFLRNQVLGRRHCRRGTQETP